MSDPNIPSIPSSFAVDQSKFLESVKSAIELLMGQGRTPEAERAARYGELTFFQADVIDVVTKQITPSGQTPDPPTDLVVTKGTWAHFLTWLNPKDEIVSHIEVWVAVNSQSRSKAILKGVVTVSEALRGKEGTYTSILGDVTADHTYWIRSVSYGGKNSTWEPPDAQGGYVVTGEDTVGEIIDNILDILTGNITEDQLYIDLSTRIDLIDSPVTGLLDLVDGLGTDLTTETSTREDEDGAIVESVTILSGVVHDPDTGLAASAAAIRREMSVMAGPESTLSIYTYELGGVVYDPVTGLAQTAADIRREITTATGPDSALASDINLLWAEVDDPILGGTVSAAALEQIVVKVDNTDSGVVASAEKLTTLQTIAGDDFTILESSMKTVDGIVGEYTMRIENNGVMSGFGVISENNDGQVFSEFMILADSFKIVSPDNDNVINAPFVVGTVDDTSTVGINGNLVVDQTILARSIQAGTITSDKLSSTDIFALRISVGANSSGFSNFTDGCDANADKTNYTAIYADATTKADTAFSQAKVFTEGWCDEGADKTSYVISDLSIINAIANGSTFVGGGYIETDILKVKMSEITDLMVTNAFIANGAITNAKIYDLHADKLTVGTITVDKIVWNAGISGSRLSHAGSGTVTVSSPVTISHSLGRFPIVIFHNSPSDVYISSISSSSFSITNSNYEAPASVSYVYM